MDWQNKTISPKSDKPCKVDVRFTCPGLFRFSAMVGFLAVGLGLYYGGASVLGIEPLNIVEPEWTVKQVSLIAVSVIISMIGGLWGATIGMSIKVQNENLNNFITIMWQFLVCGSLLWFVLIGVAMNITLGREGAKAFVLDFGPERAAIYVFAAGCILSLVFGIAFNLARTLRIKFIPYLIFSLTVSLFTAKWNVYVYGIDGKSWIFAGLLFPILVHLFAPAMVERDRQQKRLAIEQFNLTLEDEL